MIKEISNYIIPVIVLIIVLYGVFKRVNVYDEFVSGAKQGFNMSVNLFPSMLAMIFGINIFLRSGFINYFFNFLFKFFNISNFPIDILPMMVMRSISGSSSIAILNNLLKVYGTDSFIGIFASVMQGSTDTTLYILTIYFGSIGIKKIRYSLFVGLLTDFICIVLSFLVVKFLFN